MDNKGKLVGLNKSIEPPPAACQGHAEADRKRVMLTKKATAAGIAQQQVTHNK